MSCYQFIHKHRERWPIDLMADVLEVSTSGYYGWIDRPPSRRSVHSAQLAAQVQEVFENSHANYGSRKVTTELAQRSVNICRNTVAKVMRAKTLKSRAQRRKRFITTTDSNHAYQVPENLLDRNFQANGPNQKWVADITYIPVSGDHRRFAYVAAVMDLYSRRIVGWAVSDSIDTDLVYEAMTHAIESRTPGDDLLHHSDRGCQYASDRYQKLLQTHDIECSMSRKGDCWDNAVMERFMNTLKNEWANHYTYDCVEDVRVSMFQFIEIFYNRKRRHQTLGYLSPAEFEMKHQPTPNAA